MHILTNFEPLCAFAQRLSNLVIPGAEVSSVGVAMNEGPVARLEVTVTIQYVMVGAHCDTVGVQEASVRTQHGQAGRGTSP